MDITTRDEPLKWLIEKVETAEIVLPEFQRSFVWRRNDVEDLLISILKGYYVGSFILLRIDKDNTPFAPRPVEGLERDPRSLHPQWMLLDGQQRLTSLYYVFHAPNQVTLRNTSYPYHFFLDLNKLEDGDLDNAISSERSDWCKDLLGKQRQFEALIIPFTELHSSCWPTWLKDYRKWFYRKGKLSEETLLQLQDTVDKWEEVIDNLYNLEVAIVQFPQVKSDDVTAIDEVCTVFEKMNSTGIPLSVFDLATARLYKDDIKLRDLWGKANENYNLLKKFSKEETDPFGVFILRTMALIRGQDVKRKTLINLSPKNFKADWRSAVGCIQDAMNRITSTQEGGFGVFDPKWLPYSTMIPALAALLHHIKINNLDYKAYEALRKWYWGSIFLERYAGAVESTSHQDFQELVRYFEDPSVQPKVFGKIQEDILANPNFSLRSVSRRNAVYKGVINLLAIRGAKDFHTGDAIEFFTLEDHHIFPRSRLAKKKTNDAGEHHEYKSEEINTILNRTLISEGTHKLIRDHWPSEYIPEIVPSARKAEIMSSHFIDEHALAALESDQYDAFRKHRERCILATLRKYLQRKSGIMEGG
jgi:hypothetical protein